jgi:hypothetical protein
VEIDDGESTGGVIFHVKKENDTIKAVLTGPADPFLVGGADLRLPFEVTIEGDGTARVGINGSYHRLSEGVYSDWVHVEFTTALRTKVSGICKFLLLSTAPEFEMYVSPINIDPGRPAMPVSHPAIYSTYLARRHGPFATLGLAEDTWALNEKVISDEAFICESINLDVEHEKMFFDSLDKVRHGLCVCVFDGMDRIQHAFWRDIDCDHPARCERSRDGGCNAVEDIYRRADDLVGRTVEACDDDDTVLMVISDHGFNSFRCGIDLNRWLEENGYLVIGEERCGVKDLTAVDWSKTRAFAVGLAGIYLNLKGRESRGIVNPGEEAERLRTEIADKLMELDDQAREQKVFNNIYNSLKTYDGPYKGEAPDLILGYNRGYRVSWETAAGKITGEVFHENTKAWSGDHCIDHTLVPGVLFCNRGIQTENPGLMDIGPTVLQMFGVTVPVHMDGSPLHVAGSNGETEPVESGRVEAANR